MGTYIPLECGLYGKLCLLQTLVWVSDLGQRALKALSVLLRWKSVCGRAQSPLVWITISLETMAPMRGQDYAFLVGNEVSGSPALADYPWEQYLHNWVAIRVPWRTCWAHDCCTPCWVSYLVSRKENWHFLLFLRDGRVQKMFIFGVILWDLLK